MTFNTVSKKKNLPAFYGGLKKNTKDNKLKHGEDQWQRYLVNKRLNCMLQIVSSYKSLSLMNYVLESLFSWLNFSISEIVYEL